ncbi:F0F1 ATP synthase subunit delta [Dysgonomonas sp. 520]|uniref:F0F1 ATP synthase subunit delta n=1 Tax=Dysgonomonas sp. 520 TaxID=2302931 RepID=UPI0013CF5043|nr:F0F1 ATP synthase subunit delta [Dysgonomonas sp. 520]NDW10615.1 F0F1 ATP synthase subunit delta [Dysgonomonas sp. 520]
MNSGLISTRYARALFEYASDKRMEDTVFNEMKRLYAAFDGENNLRTILDNPVLLNSDKFELIKTAAGGKVSDIFERFIDLVLHQRREFQLQSICLVYMDLYRDHKNISVGRLVTASAIDKTTEDKIKRLVNTKQGGTLEFETLVDPKIDGGFILYIDTYRLDASVATQLKKIKEQLLRKNKSIV